MPTPSTTITLTLSDAQRMTVNGMATPQLDIEEGAVADPSGNGIAAAPDQPVTTTDGIPPTLTSSHYNTGTGILNMTFSEPLNGTAISYDRMAVRDAGQSSGGLALDDVGTKAVNPSSTTITLTLSDAQRMTVNGMATPQLDIEEGAVADPSGNGIAAAPDQPVTTTDGIPPTLASSHYNTGTGILNMTFSEPLNGTAISYDRIAVRDAGESSGGLALDEVTTKALNANSITITLTLSDAQRMTVNGMATHQLDIEEGAVADPTGNGIAAASDQPVTTTDGIPPTLASSHYNTGTGILNMTFSEPLNGTAISYDRIAVRDAGESSGGLALDEVTTKALNANSITITLTLSDAQRMTVNGMATPQLDIEEGAVADPTGNGIAAASDQPVTTTDGIPPTLASSHYNTGTGILNITFSEPLNGTAINYDRIAVRDANQSSGGLALNAVASKTLDSSSTTITLTLSTVQRQTVNDMITPQLDIEEGAVADPTGNGIAAAPDRPITVTDITPPTLVSSKYYIGTGILNITFSEPLNGTAISYDRIAVRDANQSSGGLALNAVASKTLDSSSTTITLTLSDAQRITVNGMATPQLDIEAGAVSDPSGNGIAAAPDQGITVIDMAPSADAGDPQTVTEGDVVTLNGARSSDIEGALSYLWAHTGGPAVTLSDATIAEPTFTAPNVGQTQNITFTLTVTDTGNLSDTANVAITVQDVPENDFVTTWETASANAAVTIPVGGSTAAYLIDWGDGTIENVSGDQTHTYADAGRHTIRISGDFERIYLGGSDTNAAKLKSIDQWGSIKWSSMAGAFSGAAAMKYNATDTPDLSGVTDMSSMFNNAQSFNGDISSWNVSQVTDTSEMFRDAARFNQDISDWDVSQVTDMSSMFDHAFDFNQPLNNWDVSQVTSMSSMFNDARSFNGDISSWDVSQVTGMSGMFTSARAFNQPLNNWNVSQVTTMSTMFSNAWIFNQDISDWDVSQVTSMSLMFQSASRFNQPLNNWNVSQVTDMSLMFQSASNFDQNLGNWYITLDSTVIAAADAPGAVANIKAQNRLLSGTYDIRPGEGFDSFNITGNKLYMTITPDKPSYNVTINVSGGEFGTDNHRLYTIMVSGPSADAGDPRTVTEGETVTLNGTRSGDTGGGDSLTYLWVQTGGPPVTLSNATVAEPTFTAPNVGGDTDITFTLTVTYADSFTDTDTVTITVNDSPNTAPSVDAGANQNVSEGDTVSLSGTASDADPEDTVLTYEWTHNATQTIDLQNAAALSTSFTAPDVSANTAVLFTLNVSDGAAHATDAVMIAIADTNTPPSADAGDPQTVPEGETVTLDGTRSSDPEDGASLSYLWVQTSGPAISLTGPSTATPTFTAPNVGGDTDITFTLTVTDSGSFTDTDNVTITVQDKPGDFLTTWATTSPNETITIPVGGSTAAYLIDWGDGTVQNATGDQTHTYADAGFHTIRISGGFERIYLAGGSSANAEKLQSIDQWGSIKWGSMAGAFQHAAVMAYYASDAPDLSGVTDMSGMFLDARSFGGDISSWDVSGVTDMSRMFLDAQSFDGDISSWDVSRVANMSRMFENARFSQNIANWNVSQVTDMSRMFLNAKSFDGDISSWDVSQVTDMSRMFENTNFNQAIANWNVSQVTDMSGMFRMNHAFDQPLNWDVSRVTDMSYMFSGVFFFDQNITSWDVSRVTNMSGMFENTPFNQDISDWNVSQVTDMSYMFSDAFLFDQNITSWDVSRVTDMSHMFEGTSFNQAISDWNVSRVTDMSYMFSKIFLFDQNITSWDVSRVTNMSGMFENTPFNQDISDWNVSQVTDMSGMFENTPFNQDISDWNVSRVTDMSYMFSNAFKFNQAISDWNVSQVTDMSGMFNGAFEFNQNLGNWYITLDSTVIDADDAPGVVANITAQNQFLSDMSVTYEIGTDGDPDHFNITDNKLYMAMMPDKASYSVTIESSASGEFGIDNHRAYTITVSGINNQGAPAGIRPDRAVYNPPSGGLPATLTLSFDGPTNGTIRTGHLSIRDALSGNTVTLAGAPAAVHDLSQIYGGPPTPLIYEVRLGPEAAALVEGAAEPVLDMGPGAVYGPAGSPSEPLLGYPITVPDVAPPAVRSVAFDPAASRLEITFTEAIDHDLTDRTGMTLRGGLANLTLPDAGGRPSQADALAVPLNRTHLDTLGGAPTHLDIAAGAVSDAAGNPIIAATVPVTIPDTVPPEVSSVTLERGTGLLEVAFTEVIDHAATKYDTMTILGTSSNITLARVDGLSATNGTISVALSQANLQAVGTPRSFSILAGSVMDTAGNPIAAATSTIISRDTTPPRASSASFQPDGGLLKVVFTEVIDHAATNYDAVAVLGESANLTLAEAEWLPFGEMLFVVLNRTNLQEMGAPQHILIPSGSVTDTAGNPITAVTVPVTTPDTVPPEVTSATYHDGTGRLAVTFSEPLDHAATDYALLSLAGPSANLTLAHIDRPTAAGGTIVVQLNATHLETLGGTPSAVSVRMAAVYDAAGNPVRPATIRIDVANPANRPPVVDAGPDRTVPEGDTVTLNGTAADPDAGDTITYLWTHNHPTLPITFADQNSLDTTLAAPDVAASTTITLTLSVTDNHNATSSDRVEITIVHINTPPTVDAGPNRTIHEGDTVTLSGMVTDPDGDALAYRWSHDPATLNITLANRIALSTTLTAPQVDADTTATLTLTASDGTASVSDTLTLTITDIPSDAPYPATAFVTTWQTSTDGESITIPVGGAAGTYTIDWGDGTVSADVTGDQTHTYDAAGTYAVGISGDFARIYLNGDANAAKLQSIDQWGEVQWESMEFAFSGASSMAYRAVDSPDLSGVSSMRYMFQDATSFNGDVSSWDVSSVTNMIGTFQGAASFNRDLSSWDVSRANDMRYMFRNATSFNGDLSTWDVSSAVDLTRMFQGAASFNRDISTWDVSSVTGTAGMFYGATSFNQPLSSWDVSSVTNMVDMFRGATSFNQPLSSWDVSSVTGTAGMFYGATSFNQDLSSWDVSRANDMDSMFRGASSFDQNLGEWYIVLDDTTLQSDDPTGAVGNITAQNPFLDGHNSTYGIGSGGDSGAFEVDGATLILRDTPAKSSYTVTVTSAGGFGSDNSRTFEITILNFNHPPTTSAGDDQTIPEGDTVALNATASDPDTGDTLTYLWTSDRPGLSISGSDTLAPSFTAPQVDTDTTITLTLSVTDSHNATATDRVTITVTDVPANATRPADTRDVQPTDATPTIPNNPPTTSAGDDQTIPEGDTVALNATASDPDTGDTLTYLWTSDRPGLSISGSDTLAPSFTAPQVDTDTTITLTLSVTDSHNATATDRVTITVTDVPANATRPADTRDVQPTDATPTIPNNPPTASAGDDQTIPEGDTVTLTGTASDPDTGDTLTYLWTSDRPGLSISGSDTLAPSFTAPQVDTDTTITLTLSVTDSHNATATDQVTITVTDVPPPNTAPTASAGDDQTIPEGDTVTLTGTASDPDTGDTLTYLWTSDRPGLSISGSDTLAPSFTAPQVDTDTTITLTLSVTDSHNATASDPVTITVTDVPPPNTAPTASAGDDQTIPEGDTVTLTGTASDPDTGDTLTYLWTSDRPGLSISGSDTLAPSFTAPQVDTDTTITLTLSVTDSHNATATDQVTITVTDVPPPNTAPTASAGDDQTIPEGDTVTLTGTASDPDTGDTLTYRWSHDSSLPITLANPAALSTTFTAPQVNSTSIVVLTLTVSDGIASSSDSLSVTITNTVPASNPNAASDEESRDAPPDDAPPEDPPQEGSEHEEQQPDP